ncbi:hypothetical protein GGR88_001321 [Sphingomonas jejuensis]|uniref:Uncharacterized protein n=1 Tax=Sphingomonas jejuensis TaxID=904715 RepID=A0ABX0XLW1_9SPHN|nr:hypothetical protein [Sphingomonas jejuensis]NJC33847.1 hypothetical protein [Sphingomonas jejuensis]
MTFLSAIFASRLALVQFVALIFAILGMFGLVPAGLEETHVVTVAMFAFAAVTIIGRLQISGPIVELDPELGGKAWWQSKTIWAQVVSAGAAIAGVAGFLPAGFDEATVLSGILAVVSVLTLLFRPTARPIA